MADLPGALKAIRDKFKTDWAVAHSTVLVQDQNTDPPQPQWPPNNTPWVYLEVINADGDLRGAGTLGDHIWLYVGTIFVHINVPIGYGIDDVTQLAWDAGEIFKAKTFYNAPGSDAKVICGAPQIAGGGNDADKGKWFTLTTAIPFEFYHRG